MKTLRSLVPLLLALMPFIALGADTIKLEDLTIMALGSLDGRAVIKNTDGKLQVVKIGDTLAGTQAVVTQVLSDKLVLEIAGSSDAHKQMVWMIKPAKAGDKSTVQRFDSDAPPGKVTTYQVLKPANVNQKQKK